MKYRDAFNKDLPLFQRALIFNTVPHDERLMCCMCTHWKVEELDKYISHTGHYCDLTGERRWDTQEVCIEFEPKAALAQLEE